jgi:NAD(P)-dependent dehydrogenase (short-subunit alcohol dehydrogenase family)
MRVMGHGTIIHIASISALHGNPGYGAFKGGVTTLKYPGAGTAVGSLAAGFKAKPISLNAQHFGTSA